MPDSGAARLGDEVQPGMTEVLAAGKRRRIVPEEMQADGEAMATDEAEPADQAGPSRAEPSSSVPGRPQGPRRLQPERVLPVKGKAPSNPQSAVTAPGDSSERSVGSDANSGTSDASMSGTDQPLQDEEELGSDEEVSSQNPYSESLQATTVSQVSASSTLSSPEDAPAASGEVVVVCQGVQAMGLAVTRALEVHVADQHTTKFDKSDPQPSVCPWQAEMLAAEDGQEAPAVQKRQPASPDEAHMHC